MFAELIDEVRRSQSATDRFDQAVADTLGVNRTDMRCLDLLEREGPVTAGRLAEATGITSGAMTTVIDRLERTGYAQRVSDPADRRRVLVQLTPQAHTIAERFYSEHMAQSRLLFGRYTTAQMELLLQFVRGGREFNEQQAALLEQRNRTGGKRPPAAS
jgi:DNA-binding MarR family transcriptional regulator